MRYDYRFKYEFLTLLLNRLAARRSFEPVCAGLLDNWERVIKDCRHGDDGAMGPAGGAK